MNTFIRIAALALAVAVAAPVAAAQPQTQPAQQNKPQIGLGVGITGSNTVGGPDTGTLLFFPIQLASGGTAFRVEPYIGWARYDIDQNNNVAQSTFEPQAPGKGSDFTLGVGGFLVAPIVQQVQVYGGGRLASQWQSFRQTNFKATRRNTILALAGGAEYMPVPRVAFGAEFQVGYISFGDTKYTQGTQTLETHGGSGSATQATLFARFFLF